MLFVIHPAIDADRLKALRSQAPEARWVNARGIDEVMAAVVQADAFLGKIRPEMLARATQLRWVQAFTASLEHYMFPELIAHDCVLTNTRGLFSDVIADQVMGYILCFARNIHHYIRQQTVRRYEPLGGEAGRVDFAAGPGTVNAMDRATLFLPDATLGIVGYGAIGVEVARRARAFGMTVRAVDRHPERVGAEAQVALATFAGLAGLDELLDASDFVVIAAPHTPETVGLFDAKLLAKMKPSARLINIGRGAIVVLDDLVESLREGRLAGAALDVFEVEPLPREHALWGFLNVILTPHTAGYSTVIARRHLALLIENVRRFTCGEVLRNHVDKALWF